MSRSLAEMVKGYGKLSVPYPYDDDEYMIDYSLREGMSLEQIDSLAKLWPFEMPDEYRTMLSVAAGFDASPHESFDFDVEPELGIMELIPIGIRLANDGTGNDYVLELNEATMSVGPVWFLCHDAPVFIFQSETLEEFIEESFKMNMREDKGLVSWVYEYKMHDIWKNDPGLVTAGDARNSSDSILREFAESVDEDYLICDLRNALPGDGFSWGKAVLGTECRYGGYRLFAFRKQRSLLSRLFGKR